MTATIEPQDLEGLLAAYALGAVDGDERVGVEAAVANDETARNQLRGFERGAELLSSTDGPSPDVWSRIEAAISDDDRRAVVVPIGSGARRAARPARRRIVRAVGIAAAAAAALALAVWGVDTIDQSYSTAPAADVQRAAQEATLTEGARLIVLTTPDGSSVEVVVLPDGLGYVLDGDLPIAPDGAVYRLFGLTDDGPVLLAVIGDRIEATAFQLPPEVTDLVLELGNGSIRDRLASARVGIDDVTAPPSASSPSTPRLDAPDTGAPSPPSVGVPTLPGVVPPSSPGLTLPGLTIPGVTLPSLPFPISLPLLDLPLF